MDNKIKNYLGIAIIVSIIVVALAAAFSANSFSDAVRFSAQRNFSVSSDGKAVGIPDIAEFTFSVITEGGKNVGALQKENSDKMNKAIDFLKAQKIDSQDIKTQNYSLEPRYQYCSYVAGKTCPPPEIVGYSLTQTASVKIRDFSKISDILSGVVASGANSVSQLSFKVDDSTSLENQARTEAIQKAKQKAETVAKAGGFTLGRLLSIDEGGGYVPAYRYNVSSEMGGGSVESVTPKIEPGSQEVSVSVTLRYEIK
jgi:uncharacterized protein YggE